jgi:hypothetical protein
MHDLDRTLQEFEAGYDALESYDDEFGDEFEFEGDWEAEEETEDEAVFDEIEEMELAADEQRGRRLHGLRQRRLP